MRTSLALAAALLAALPGGSRGEPVDLGTRLELFVDRLLVEELRGLSLKLHQPQLAPDPAEGARPDGAYATVLRAPDKFQLYYRGSTDPAVNWKTHGAEKAREVEVTLYAESEDGIRWTKPDLGLWQHPAFPEGNIVLMGEFNVNHNFSPFLDTRPGVPEAERYKALGGLAYQPQPEHEALREKRGPGGLVAFVSPDGIRWRRLRQEPVIPEDWGKYFDSQNHAFWSESEQRYVCYFRRFSGGYRSIARTTSLDFIEWTPYVEMKPNLTGEHLYTPGTQPYFRAPHLYVALPTRFMDRRGAATDILFMTSRGGGAYQREFTESFIRPGLGPDGWKNRANYAAIGIHQTGEDEMSFFLTGGRRYRMRLDGFASVNAPLAGGELLTKPLSHAGRRLVLNYSTSAAGQIRVEMQDLSGAALPGFSLEDCDPIWGDHLAREVTWRGNADLSAPAGQPVRLRFEMSDADLYALRFQ